MMKLEEPDKGHAWVVAISACIINMILSGLSRMVGILYVSVLETYGVSRQEATLPFTVRSSIRCLSGPLAGVAGQRYGIRAVTFYGGVVAAVGAALCCIAPSTIWLAVFWGGIHGLGFAFAGTLFQVVVNQCFQKHRATASGIALSGACVGSFVFPVMIEAILDTFGLSGGFLILGGIVMHVLPPSVLMKAPPWVEDPEGYARLKALKVKQQSFETFGTDIPENPPEIDLMHEFRDLVRSTSFDNCPAEEFEVCSANRSLKGSSENLPALSEYLTFKNRESKCAKNVACTLFKISESLSMEKKTCAGGGSIISVNEKDGTTICTISGDVHDKENNINNSGLSEDKPAAADNQNTTMWESIKGIAILYTSPVYLLISICMATYLIIFIPMQTVIVDYGMDKGIPVTAGKYLINSMALGDLIGRLCFGWVTDRGIISIPVFMMFSLILEGIFIALLPFSYSLYSLIILLLLYGITAGTILVHFPLLVLKYVDQNFQSVGMGSVRLLSGIMSFGIPSLIGYFRDNVGSYDGLFYLTGAISVVSGIMWLSVPAMEKFQHKKENKKVIMQSIVTEHSKNGGTVSS